MKTGIPLVILLLAVSASPSHAQKHPSEPYPGFEWPNKIPADCPFEPSDKFAGIYFTGKNHSYAGADNWVLTWAANGECYSPYTDGTVVNTLPNGSTQTFWALGSPAATSSTGNVRILGDDPANLTLVAMPATVSSSKPYHAGYPSGSLAHNGLWYYGYHVEGPGGNLLQEDGTEQGWSWIGGHMGFRISADGGKTWTPSPHTPKDPLFDEGPGFPWGTPVRLSEIYFVDYGRNNQHSPDGKAYLVAHGASEPHPEGPQFVTSSWNVGDQASLLRVTPTPETINDPSAYEYFAGHGADGEPVWSSDIADMKPLIEWKGKIGMTTITWNPVLNRYFFCITDGHRGFGPYDTYILESEKLTGPWKIVVYMENFGEQAYCVNFPSKFIGADGITSWLCYAGNFSHSTVNPPGGGYRMTLQKIRLIEKPSVQPPKPPAAMLEEAEGSKGNGGICGSIGLDLMWIPALIWLRKRFPCKHLEMKK